MFPLLGGERAQSRGCKNVRAACYSLSTLTHTHTRTERDRASSQTNRQTQLTVYCCVGCLGDKLNPRASFQCPVFRITQRQHTHTHTHSILINYSFETGAFPPYENTEHTY